MKFYLFLITLLICLASQYQTETVKFGMILYTEDGKLPHFASSSLYLKAGMDLFQKWTEENGPIEIDGEEYTFEMVYRYDDGSDTESTYMKLVEDDKVDILVGSFGTAANLAASAVGQNKSKIVLGTSTLSTEFYQNRQFSFSVYPTAYSQISSVIPLLRLAGASSITLLLPDSSLISHGCVGIEKALEENYIEDIEYIYYANILPTEPGNNFTNVVDEIIKRNKDVLLYCGNNVEHAAEIGRLMRINDYTPKAAITTAQEKVINGTSTDIEYWIRLSTIMETEKKLPDGPYIGSRENYDKFFFRIYGENPDFLKPSLPFTVSYYGLVPCELVLNALTYAKTKDTYQLSDAIKRSRFNSLVGLISYNVDNAPLNPGVAYQFVLNESDIVVINPLTVSNSSIIYPMPTWEERLPYNKFTAYEISVTVILAISIINSIGWIIYVLLKRDEKRIRSSSPIFLLGMLFGSIVIYVATFVWSPYFISKASCTVVPWLLSLGFTLLFGSMLVKTWRVHLLFSSKTLEIFKISNRKVLVFLTLALSVDIIILIVWTSVSNIKTKDVIVDEYRISKNYEVCQSNTAGKVLIWIDVAYKVLLILYGGYLALRIRTIPMKIYDESKIIAFCIYNVGISSVIIAILQATSPTGRYIIYTLNSLLIILSTSITINTMMLGKTISKKEKNSTSTGNTTGLSSVNSYNLNSMGSSNGDYNDLYEKYNESQKMIEKLKKKVKKLKSQLEQLTKNSE